MNRIKLVIGVSPVVLALLVAACGGGGINSTPAPSPTPVPTPAPTPAPTPVPTPTPTPDSSLPLTDSAVFETITGDRDEHSASNKIVVDSISTAGRSSTVTFRYDAQRGTYSLSNDGTSATFDINRGTKEGSVTRFMNQSGNATDAVQLLDNLQAKASGQLALSYLSYGIWLHENSDAGTSNLTYFLFGFPTTPSQMPRSGSATYAMTVTGSVRDIRPTITGETREQFDGNATFTANFAAGTVQTLITLDGRLAGDYAGDGTILSDQFGGTFSSTNRYFQSGSFKGGFFGPNADEAGYTFEIYNHNPDPFAGASVNYVDQWAVGTVVGAKSAP